MHLITSFDLCIYILFHLCICILFYLCILFGIAQFDLFKVCKPSASDSRIPGLASSARLLGVEFIRLLLFSIPCDWLFLLGFGLGLRV